MIHIGIVVEYVPGNQPAPALYGKGEIVLRLWRIIDSHHIHGQGGDIPYGFVLRITFSVVLEYV